MRRRLKGFLKNAGTQGEAALVGRSGGYHETWDTGTAHSIKNRQKLTGTNRPST